jgi:hypothetical protein
MPRQKNTSDKRLFQRDIRTKRYNVVNLPRSGAFGRRKTTARAFFGKGYCQCATPENNYIPGIGCFQISDSVLSNLCDWVVQESTGSEFDEFEGLGFPEPPYPYNTFPYESQEGPAESPFCFRT